LELSVNEFIGTVPFELGSLTLLKYLDFYRELYQMSYCASAALHMSKCYQYRSIVIQVPNARAVFAIRVGESGGKYGRLCCLIGVGSMETGSKVTRQV
jgi:hypothetical protein